MRQIQKEIAVASRGQGLYVFEHRAAPHRRQIPLHLSELNGMQGFPR